MSFTQFARFVAIASAFVGVMILTGCASSGRGAKFEAGIPKNGFAYGQVNKADFTDEEIAKACKAMPDSDLIKGICNRSDDRAVFLVGLLRNGGGYQYGESYPKTISLKPGAIVKLDMSKPRGSRFVEVVTEAESETCKWVGGSNFMLDRTALKDFRDSVTAFTVAAAVPVVGAAALITSRNTTGGVECNGWSYKEAYKDFLASN